MSASYASSSDGSHLVAFDDHGEVIAWSVTASATAEIYHATVAGVLGALFMTPSRLLVQQGSALRAIPLETSAGPAIVVNTSNVVAIDGRADAVVTGTRDGAIELRSSALTVISTNTFCHAPLTSVQLVSGKMNSRSLATMDTRGSCSSTAPCVQ
jgi:hypothetical protein